MAFFVFFIKTEFVIKGFSYSSIKHLIFISILSILFYFLNNKEHESDLYYYPELAILAFYLLFSSLVFSYIGYKKHFSIKS